MKEQEKLNGGGGGVDSAVQWQAAWAGKLWPGGQTQLAGFVNKALSAQGHTHLFTHHLWLPSSTRQRRALVTETV